MVLTPEPNIFIFKTEHMNDHPIMRVFSTKNIFVEVEIYDVGDVFLVFAHGFVDYIMSFRFGFINQAIANVGGKRS